MTLLFSFIWLLCQILTMAIILRVVVSWFSSNPANFLVNILHKITEPVLAPLRRIIPRAGVMDFTPMVAVILLQLIAFLLS